MRPPVKYTFISPDGKKYQGENIRKFAAEHGLCQANMYHVHAGERRHYKGWTAPVVGT